MAKKLVNGLMDVALPKWPQMYTTGKPVTVEQAKEIIRRTDLFFTMLYAGNRQSYNDMVAKKLNVPLISFTARSTQKGWDEIDRRREQFHKRWGSIRTAYVTNQWVSCSFVGGPHGWCHPDGKIGFIDNVGKWPQVEAVYEDWKMLVKEFPFLEVDVSLKSGESLTEGITTLVGFKIRKGKIKLVGPETVLHEDHPPATRGNRFDNFSDEDAMVMRMTTSDAEQGLPITWIEEWAKDPKLTGRK